MLALALCPGPLLFKNLIGNVRVDVSFPGYIGPSRFLLEVEAIRQLLSSSDLASHEDALLCDISLVEYLLAHLKHSILPVVFFWFPHHICL
jgi:hypothetical protein